MFEFDLNKVEAALKNASFCKLGVAASFNSVRKKPVQSASMYVLSIDEDYQKAVSINGVDEYNCTELFAVMIVIPCSAANRNANEQIRTLKNKVKQALAGLVIDDFDPIELHRSRIVEFNQDTNNLIYQCQFRVTGYLTVEAKQP